jgi:Fe-S-cluster containining protein
MLANLKALHAKIDAFFERVQYEHREHMQCRSGCSLCCQQSLSLFPVEMQSVVARVEELPEDAQDRIRYRLAHPTPSCPLLEEDRCVIYEARPTICRSHGLPIEVSSDDGRKSRSSCPLNFAGVLPLHRVRDGNVLDIDRLNKMLVLVNQLALDEGQVEVAERLDLRATLRAHLGRHS